MRAVIPHARERAAGAVDAPACGAKTRAGTPCKQPAMANGRCRMHGGRMMPGPAHPAYKHGRTSSWVRSLPSQLKEAAQQSIAQGAEIAQDDSIATLDALLEETSSQMDRGASEGLWKALGEHASEARKLRAKAERLGTFEPTTSASDSKGREEAMEAFYDYQVALDATFTLIDEGAAYAGHRQEIVRLLEQRRKHADTEIKRRTAVFASMQASQVLALAQTLIELAIGHISDRSDKAAFVREVREVLPGLITSPREITPQNEEIYEPHG